MYETFTTFKPNDQIYGYIHDIVYDNMIVVGTNVHDDIINNSAKRSFKPF
jgi:hypothetical protein